MLPLLYAECQFHIYIYTFVINKTYLSNYRESYTNLISRSTATNDKSAFGSACSTVALNIVVIVTALYCTKAQFRNSRHLHQRGTLQSQLSRDTQLAC